MVSRKFFVMETATERCSLKIVVPKFSKYQERLLIILAKFLVCHCTSLYIVVFHSFVQLCDHIDIQTTKV